MKKLLNHIKNLSWSLLLGGALLFAASACSKGTDAGEVNVEESDYKDKSPTEHNPPGLSDNTQDNDGQIVPGAVPSDSSYEEVYDRQEKKRRQKGGTTGNQAFGGAAETKKNND